MCYFHVIDCWWSEINPGPPRKDLNSSSDDGDIDVPASFEFRETGQGTVDSA